MQSYGASLISGSYSWEGKAVRVSVSLQYVRPAALCIYQTGLHCYRALQGPRDPEISPCLSIAALRKCRGQLPGSAPWLQVQFPQLVTDADSWALCKLSNWAPQGGLSHLHRSRLRE